MGIDTTTAPWTPVFENPMSSAQNASAANCHPDEKIPLIKSIFSDFGNWTDSGEFCNRFKFSSAIFGL